MGHSFIKASVMDDLNMDISSDIDDHMDDAELLPFRYQSLIEVQLPLG
jgi:hypothetical protein